jgi:hypothetical protein
VPFQARRPSLAPSENSAILVLEIARAIPKDWPVWNQRLKKDWDFAKDTIQDVEQKEAERQRVAEEIYKCGPRQRLSSKASTLLDAELARAADPLATARKLPSLPNGRYQFDFPLIWISALVADLQKAREVASLLQCRALQASQKGDAETACQAALAICHVGRSFGEPDTLIAHLVRIAVMSIAVDATEQALSLGQADKSTLEHLQQLFQKEDLETPALLLHAVKSERALMHRMMDAVWHGRLTWQQLQNLHKQSDSLWDRFYLNLGLAHIREQHADFLRQATEEIERWKTPWDPASREPEPEKSWYEAMIRGWQKVRLAGARTQALMRCASTALAAERFRLDHRAWPKSLEDLQPPYLSQIPKDPFATVPFAWPSRRMASSFIPFQVTVKTTVAMSLVRHLGNLEPITACGYGTPDREKRLQSMKRSRPCGLLRFSCIPCGCRGCGTGSKSHRGR